MKKKITKPFSVEAYNNGAKVETRDGRAVRILCTDARSVCPIVALLIGESDEIATYHINGRFSYIDHSDKDLVIVEEVDEPEKWDENTVRKGYVLHTNVIAKSEGKGLDIFATEKQAKSALAMARISQIMANDPRFGGVITDEEWGNEEVCKYEIARVRERIWSGVTYTHYHRLAFHTAEQRDLFLEEHEDLVNDYLMID
ncbi:MAG: hypothetical protein J6034_07790 [Bacteroidaceae bacterium]|nr:hypothetical protein [Bacteroidaceae bacterium]